MPCFQMGFHLRPISNLTQFAGVLHGAIPSELRLRHGMSLLGRIPTAYGARGLHAARQLGPSAKGLATFDVASDAPGRPPVVG